MALRSFSVTGFRAFSSTGTLPVGALTGIVGRNDCGKSGLLHALRLFFEPPKKGLLQTDPHLKDAKREVIVSLAFDPAALPSTKVKVDAKNELDITEDKLLAGDGLLRVRLRLAIDKDPQFELQIEDTDDSELFPLALKKHDELLTLLTARNLPAKKAGKETNQEKRAALRQQAAAAGIGQREAWHDASAIERQIRALLPQWVYFADTARFGIDETPVQNQFKSIVDKAVPTHTEAQAIEAAIRTSVQSEFDKVFAFLGKLTPNIAGLIADTRVSWKKAVEEVALSWTDPFGIALPYDQRGAGIRRLFMLAYFQYLVADALYSGTSARYLFAIEEPELHLHPGAQRDLIEALRELGSLGHSVVFTTHSPVFASAPDSDRLILIRRATASAEALTYPNYSSLDLAHELGVEASDRLVGKDHVILVEGPKDVQFFEYLLDQHYKAGMTTLSPQKVLFLQCGGMHNLNFVATTECMARAGLKWAVLMDSDRSAPGGAVGPVAHALATTPPATCVAVRVLERSFIENYLDSADVLAETGIPCAMPAFGKPLDAKGKVINGWERIKQRGPAIAMRMGHAKLVKAATLPNGTCEWTGHFEAIRIAFGM